MTEQVIARINQTSKRLKYQPGADSCRCLHCSIFSTEHKCLSSNGIQDWEIPNDPDEKCCGGLCRNQPVCAHPDKNECFIGLSSSKEDPLVEYGWDKKAPMLKCVYNLDKINTRSQLNAFNAKFGVNNDVEARYCTQRVNTCPNDLNSCSRLMSIGEGGDLCRSWFEKQPASIKDATIQNYCLRNDTDDCKCVNRFNKQSYISMKGAKGINDGCWYIPCSNKSNYLVPSHLQNPTCPDKMCDILFEFGKTENVSFDDVKNDITCDFNSKSNFRDSRDSEPLTEEPPEKKSFFKQKKFIIIVVGVVVASFFVVYFLHMYF
jgi:hypothetical protein